MERLITAINTALGTILVLVALAFPFLEKGIIADIRHAKVEDVVRRMADEERSFYRSRNKFFTVALGDSTVNFPNKTVELASAARETGFNYEAFQESGEYLVIRAHPTKEELLSGLFRPQVLTFRTHPKNNEETLEWSNDGR